jgi:hypothetical protein
LIFPYCSRNRRVYSLSSPPGVSLSTSVAVTATGARPGTLAVIVALPPAVSSSSAADTVNVRGLVPASRPVVGDTVTSASPVRDRLRTPSPDSGAESRTVNVSLPPSETASAVGVTISCGPEAGVTVNARSAVAVALALSYALAWTV